MGYSRSWNYFTSLSKIGVNAEFIKLDQKKLIKNFIAIKKRTSRKDVFIVMSPSHYLVPFTKIFLGNNTFLDAGWSLFEGSILTRRQLGFIGTNIVKSYLIDLIASIFAKRIILESKAQKTFYCKLFLVRKTKCSVIYTGVDEEQFKLNTKFETPLDLYNNSKIVLYRGKFTTEAGLEVLAEASKLLSMEEITFWVFSPEIPKDLEFSRNTFVVSEFVDAKQNLATIYSKAKLTLGQLSNHPRLSRTIPHKAYESAFLSKPYLSARTKGILELFTEDKDILCFNPGEAQDLANKIKTFFTNSHEYAKIGIKMNKKYDSELSQLKLAAKFIGVVEDAL
jgi:glycosyltransferase involved in cell wall biosynthesis